MPQTSLLGAGAPKQRTINVEVNLLAEWIESRNRLREDRLRWTGILVTVALFSMILLPFLSSRAAREQARAHRAMRQADLQAALLTRLGGQLNVVQPQIDGEATLDLCRGRSRLFMAQMFAVLNATTGKIVVDSVEGNVLAGEMSLRVKAQAVDYPAAQEFVAAAGRGNRVKAAILATTRQNGTLGPEGIAFEFAKKVGVGP